MKYFFIATFLLLSLSLVSCKKILMLAYGIKEPRSVTREEVKNMSNSLGIDLGKSYMLRKNFFSSIEQKDTIKEKVTNKCSPMISKYKQPLQLLYFNEKGELISFHNNCYAGGFPKLNWNKDHQFDEFVPITTIPISDSILKLELLIANIEPVEENNISVPNNKITVILFWSGFMLKQSKGLIKVAKKNMGLDLSQSSNILYVNTDNCFTE